MNRSYIPFRTTSGRASARSILFDLDDCGFGIDDPEVDDGVDGHRNVVLGHHLLARDDEGHDSQVHLDHAVHDRDEEDHARSFGAEQSAESEDDSTLVFPGDFHRNGQ